MSESIIIDGNQRKSTRKGGKRPGAGRPKGGVSRATPAQKDDLSARARLYTDVALKALVAIAKGAESEAAQVAAANALLDRGYGRARQALEVSGTDGTPLAVAITHEIIDPAAPA